MEKYSGMSREAIQRYLRRQALLTTKTDKQIILDHQDPGASRPLAELQEAIKRGGSKSGLRFTFMDKSNAINIPEDGRLKKGAGFDQSWEFLIKGYGGDPRDEKLVGLSFTPNLKDFTRLNVSRLILDKREIGQKGYWVVQDSAKRIKFDVWKPDDRSTGWILVEGAKPQTPSFKTFMGGMKLALVGNEAFDRIMS